MEKNSSDSLKPQNNEPKLWPSERIPQGGLFHSPKIEYSKETADLLKLLMKESKMSMMMRKKIETHLRNGEPLPKPEPPRINTSADPDQNALEILDRAHKAKRRHLNQIMSSGAYEMIRYRPKPDGRMASEKAKKILQEAMAGIRLSDPTLKPKRRPKEVSEITAQDMIDELLSQINERAEWLAEMEELGEAKKYREEMRQQIADRLRQIKAIESKEQMKKKGFRFID